MLGVIQRFKSTVGEKDELQGAFSKDADYKGLSQKTNYKRTLVELKRVFEVNVFKNSMYTNLVFYLNKYGNDTDFMDSYMMSVVLLHILKACFGNMFCSCYMKQNYQLCRNLAC